MKKLLPFFILTLMLHACKEPADPPSAVLDEMFTAMQAGNYDDMKKHISKNDVALLDAAEKFLTGVDSQGVNKIKSRIMEEMKNRSENISYSIINEKIDGNRATVEASVTINDTAISKANQSSTQKFELVKEDHAWKIAITRPGNEIFNSMKGNLGGREPNLKDGVEKLKQVDPDSLKMLIGKGIEVLDSIDKAKQKQ